MLMCTWRKGNPCGLSDLPFTFHFHALEKETATHSSVLTWRIPGTREPGGLPSMGSHGVGHDWSDLAVAAAVTMENSTQVLPKIKNGTTTRSINSTSEDLCKGHEITMSKDGYSDAYYTTVYSSQDRKKKKSINSWMDGENVIHTQTHMPQCNNIQT